MTAHGVISAVDARRMEASESMTRLAYRVARFGRVQHKHFPRTEASMFAAAKPKRQTIGDQLATARLITSAMRH